ncbi:hypothetical protein CS8_033770 [Cupriavidus sp. 8B]
MYQPGQRPIQRLRFVLDFAYATGLRASELVSATLGGIDNDPHGDHWLSPGRQGAKASKVALPSLARAALDRNLVERGLPVTPAWWATNFGTKPTNCGT